jgi:hypothetical protein
MKEIQHQARATNQEIDGFTLRTIQEKHGEGKTTNLILGLALLRQFKHKLPRTDDNHWGKTSDIHNAQEIANRACQRLRKTGKASYHPKRKWEATQKKESKPQP